MHILVYIYVERADYQLVLLICLGSISTHENNKSC
jgi:hypothetical protein